MSSSPPSAVCILLGCENDPKMGRSKMGSSRWPKMGSKLASELCVTWAHEHGAASSHAFPGAFIAEHFLDSCRCSCILQYVTGMYQKEKSCWIYGTTESKHKFEGHRTCFSEQLNPVTMNRNGDRAASTMRVTSTCQAICPIVVGRAPTELVETLQTRSAPGSRH